MMNKWDNDTTVSKIPIISTMIKTTKTVLQSMERPNTLYQRSGRWLTNHTYSWTIRFDLVDQS